MMIRQLLVKIGLGSLVGCVVVLLALPLSAQVQTTTTVQHGAPTKAVTVESGEIVDVSGNTVIVKMEDGTLKEFDNVPDSTTFTVDGQPVTVRDAKVGMKLEKQTVTTTTPRVVTTVETVSGKVFHVSPPDSVILTLDNNQNQTFKVPKGQKFVIDGRDTDVWGLKKGMRVSAQRVTEEPATVVTQEVKRTGTAPPRPTPPQPGAPILIAVVVPPSPPAQAAAQEPATVAKLPETATNLPLLALLGGAFCVLALLSKGIRMIRSI